MGAARVESHCVGEGWGGWQHFPSFPQCELQDTSFLIFQETIVAFFFPMGNLLVFICRQLSQVFFRCLWAKQSKGAVFGPRPNLWPLVYMWGEPSLSDKNSSWGSHLCGSSLHMSVHSWPSHTLPSALSHSCFWPQTQCPAL